jgi:hypothetical protein
VKVGNVFAELRSEKPEPGPVWKDPYMGMEFVFVRGGSYQMGDIYGDGSDNVKSLFDLQPDVKYSHSSAAIPPNLE